MPDPKKNQTKRDLATPLAPSKFDPADANKDGSVSVKEQKAYNKVQRLKQKGAESLKDRQARRAKVAGGVGAGAATALTLAEKAQKLMQNKKNPGS